LTFCQRIETRRFVLPHQPLRNSSAAVAGQFADHKRRRVPWQRLRVDAGRTMEDERQWSDVSHYGIEEAITSGEGEFCYVACLSG